VSTPSSRNLANDKTLRRSCSHHTPGLQRGSHRPGDDHTGGFMRTWSGNDCPSTGAAPAGAEIARRVSVSQSTPKRPPRRFGSGRWASGGEGSRGGSTPCRTGTRAVLLDRGRAAGRSSRLTVGLRTRPAAGRGPAQGRGVGSGEKAFMPGGSGRSAVVGRCVGFRCVVVAGVVVVCVFLQAAAGAVRGDTADLHLTIS